VGDAEDEPRKEAAAVIQRAEAGAARERRAGLDLQRVPHVPREPNPALLRQAEERAQSVPNRISDRITAIADQQWQTVKDEDRQNEELLELSRRILDLAEAIHGDTAPRATAK
jgi:hypothetical protein